MRAPVTTDLCTNLNRFARHKPRRRTQCRRPQLILSHPDLLYARALWVSRSSRSRTGCRNVARQFLRQARCMTATTPHAREHGHGDGAVAAAYQQSGGQTCLVTAGADGKIKLWTPSGELLRETDDNEDALFCVAISPDGTFMAVGDDTKVVVRAPPWVLHQARLCGSYRKRQRQNACLGCTGGRCLDTRFDQAPHAMRIATSPGTSYSRYVPRAASPPDGRHRTHVDPGIGWGCRMRACAQLNRSSYHHS